MARYRYDAQGRRIEFINSPPGGVTTTTRYYYDGQNVISEYDESGDIQRTYVHGSQSRRAGIDERAVMRRHAAPEDHYYLLEELYSVAGLAGANGNLQEAYVYDTYGEAEIWDWPVGDLDRDGQVSGAQGGNDYDWLASYVTTSGTETDHPFADLDGDGDVDADDLAELDGNDDLTATETTYSSLDNPYFFTGRTTDTWHASNLLVSADPNYQRNQWNRNRDYGPKHARWRQREPNRYVDGPNLYQYVKSRPGFYVDWSGDEASESGSPATQPTTQPTINNLDPSTYLGGLLGDIPTTCGIYVVRLTLAAQWPGHTFIVWQTGSLGFVQNVPKSDQGYVSSINKGNLAVSVYGVTYRPFSEIYNGPYSFRRWHAYGAGPKGVEGKCCPSSPNCADIIGCLSKQQGKAVSGFSKNPVIVWPGETNCNSFARYALETCCLARGSLVVNGYTSLMTPVGKADTEFNNMWGWAFGPSGVRYCCQ